MLWYFVLFNPLWRLFSISCCFIYAECEYLLIFGTESILKAHSSLLCLKAIKNLNLLLYVCFISTWNKTLNWRKQRLVHWCKSNYCLVTFSIAVIVLFCAMYNLKLYLVFTLWAQRRRSWVTCGTGTASPSGAPEFIPNF